MNQPLQSVEPNSVVLSYVIEQSPNNTIVKCPCCHKSAHYKLIHRTDLNYCVIGCSCGNDFKIGLWQYH